MVTREANPTTTPQECKSERALQLFCSTYGLTLADAYTAADYEAEHGTLRASRVLRLITNTGCSFFDAAKAVHASDTYLAAARLTF